jgi:hypothetical protein
MSTDELDDLDAAERLMAKLRAFVRDGLDDDERVLFARLVAPGILEAHARAVAVPVPVDADDLDGDDLDGDDLDGEDVAGFGYVGPADPDSADWRPAPLPAALVRAVERANVRIVIDGD